MTPGFEDLSKVINFKPRLNVVRNLLKPLRRARNGILAPQHIEFGLGSQAEEEIELSN
jgi:hypothetical protein